jgi:hypothetical protein
MYNVGLGATPTSAQRSGKIETVNLHPTSTRHNSSAVDVTNPKTLAQKGLSNSAGLPQQIANVISEMQADTIMGDSSSLVDAVGMPIMMIVQDVESMSLVVQRADKIEE